MTHASNSDSPAPATATHDECGYPWVEHSFEQDWALSWYDTGSAQVPIVWWICPFDEKDIPR